MKKNKDSPNSLLCRAQQRNGHCSSSCCFCCAIQHHITRRQQQRQPKHYCYYYFSFSKLAPPFFTTNSHQSFSLVPMLLVAFLLVSFQVSPTPAFSLPIRPDPDRHSPANQTLKPPQELHKLTSARAYLRKINKPSIKTIQAFSFSTIFLQTQTSPVFYRNVAFHPTSQEIFNTICEKVSENIRVERNISIRYVGSFCYLFLLLRFLLIWVLVILTEYRAQMVIS